MAVQWPAATPVEVDCLVKVASLADVAGAAIAHGRTTQQIVSSAVAEHRMAVIVHRVMGSKLLFWKRDSRNHLRSWLGRCVWVVWWLE